MTISRFFRHLASLGRYYSHSSHSILDISFVFLLSNLNGSNDTTHLNTIYDLFVGWLHVVLSYENS
jgi:hypothetical protein